MTTTEISKKKKWMMENKDRLRRYRKNWENRNWENRLWNNAKRSARYKGRPFDIEVSDIHIPDVCPILDIPLVRGSIEKTKNSDALASLDCIDPTKGYTKGNIWVISFLANKMKQNATLDQLKSFCSGIEKCFFNGVNSTLTFLVEVYDLDTHELHSKFGPFDLKTATNFDYSLEVDMDKEKYYTKLVKC